MTTRRRGFFASPYLAIASAVVLGTTIGYARLLDEQGSLRALDGRMAAVLALLGGFALLSAVGSVAKSARVRTVIAAACTAGLLPLGFLGLWSVGPPLLLADVIAAMAWARAVSEQSSETAAPSVIAAIAAVLVLVAALAATN